MTGRIAKVQIGRMLAGAAVVAGALVFAAPQVSARDLVIGLHEALTSTDPHWMTTPSNFQINSMIFEPMVVRGNDGKPAAHIATSWERPDDLTWIFHLRNDVKWHDGSPLTAEDVAFTYGRAGKVPNSPSSFSTYLNQIAKVEAPDPTTVKITTSEPAPTLLDKLAYVLLVSKKVGTNATTEDYNSGKAEVGTGPYKFVSWALNDRTVIEKNSDYWGKKQPWDRVTYRMMINDATRLAALLAGDIDILDTVPSNEIERLKANPDVRLWSSLTAKTTAISIYTDKAVDSGKVTGPGGEKLDKNPLADPKVRQAMAVAIDRDAFIKRFYMGEAVAASQYVPEGGLGFSPEIKLEKGDLVKARALMDEAGWTNKFKLEISVAPTFFESATQVSEALAQTWTRIGIPTTVQSIPYPVLIGQTNEGKTALIVAAYMNSTGTADNYFPPLIHTVEPARGYGNLNMARYSNKAVDALIEKGMATMDNTQRSKVFQDAAKIAIEDYKVIPLWFSRAVHATKKDFEMDTRVDFQVLATNVRQAGGKAAATPAK